MLDVNNQYVLSTDNSIRISSTMTDQCVHAEDNVGSARLRSPNHCVKDNGEAAIFFTAQRRSEQVTYDVN